MNMNSPVFGWKGNNVRAMRNEDELRSPFRSPPPSTSPGFSPYSYSSPKKQTRGPMRYFNNSNNQQPSPYKQQHNRNNREQLQKGTRRSSTDPPNISMYYDSTATENPWAQLEKEYIQKNQKESSKCQKLSPTLTSS